MLNKVRNNYEWQRGFWKEAVVAYFKILSRLAYEEIGNNHEENPKKRNLHEGSR
jgi:hypothetical protein